MSSKRTGNLANQLRRGRSQFKSFGVSPDVPVIEEPAPAPEKFKRHPKAKQEKLTVVNIKIPESQQEWLASTARLVRANNDAPVPPGDRVYPQHLIQVAIDMLRAQPIDWESIKTIEDLRKVLEI